MKEIKIDLEPLIRKLEAVLKRGFSHDLLAGNYRSVYKGKGMEFVGFREYVPSDDAMLIDWKASLRSHKSMVRVLEEERNVTVFFLLDVSDSMLFSSHKKLKCEYAAELVATLCYAIHQVGDNVGIALFSDGIVKMVLPSQGRNQFYRIVRALSNPKNYGGSFNLSQAMNYVLSLQFLQKDSIVFVVSDFIGLKPGWETGFKLAGIKHDFSAIVVRDPVDMRLPDIGAEVHFGDPYSKEQMIINPRHAKKSYDAAAASQIARLKKELNKTFSTLWNLETNQEFIHEIFNFFHMKQKFKR